MILREFLPLKVGGEVLGVVGLWRDAIPILDRLDEMRREIVIVTLRPVSWRPAACSSSSGHAAGWLTRQTAALLESTRRDPLTETLNHGASAWLAEQIEGRAARSGRSNRVDRHRQLPAAQRQPWPRSR